MSESNEHANALADALASHQKGKLAEAEETCRAIIAADPTQADALKLLAVFALERGQLLEARDFAAAACRLRPASGEYLHLLGHLQLQSGELEAAAKSLSAAVTSGAPNLNAARLELASCQGRRKAWRESLTAASGVLSEQPNDAVARRLAGYACFSLGRDAEALTHFERSLAGDASQAGVWHASSVLFLRAGNPGAAHRTAAKAAALLPDNVEYAYQYRLAAAKAVPDWHFNMVHDSARNDAFARAIELLVARDQVVLDIGSGTGLLAMLAARGSPERGGSQRVVTCEENPTLARVAADTIAKNGLGDRVRVHAKRSTELQIGVDLPEKADLLICEIFSVQVVAEGVLPSVADAKARLLKEGATVIPAAAIARGALVGGPALERKVRVRHVMGFDLSPLNAFPPVVQYLQPGLELKFLSEACELLSFDLAGAAHFPAEKRTVRVGVTVSGTCQGVVQWLRLQLTSDIAFERRPDDIGANDSQHWAPVFYPFPEPLTVEAGQQIELRVSHNCSALRVELARG